MKNKGSAKAKAKAMITKVVKAAATKQKQPNRQKGNGSNVTQKLLNTAASIGMSMAGKAISRITGVGDYRVKSNTIETAGGVLNGEVPHFGKENNSTRIRHREFIKDILVPVAPAAFNNDTFVINPANADMFPWLSSIAQNYQQYRIHGMVLVFKTTTSDYSLSGGMGKVAMATNYNVRDSAYANMVELENAEFSVSGKPSVSRVHPIECASNNGLPLVRYVRDLEYDPAGGDDRLYDAGKFQFATQGLPGTAGTVLGELWCTYDIELYKPIIGRNPEGTAYEPVLVPVFNTLGGNGTHSLFQIEKTYLDGESFIDLTSDQKWELIHRPDKFERFTGIGVDTALITRSLERPVPDPDPPLYTYPAYWQAPDDPYLPNKRELRLTRPGIWYIHFQVESSHLEGSVANVSNSCLSTNPVLAPSSLTQYQLQGIELTARLANGNVNPAITTLSAAAKGCGAGYVPPTRNNIFAGNNVVYYRDGMNWTLILWVLEDWVVDGQSIAVRFQTPNETSNTIGPKFQWESSEVYNSSYIRGLSFEVGVVTVAEQTYYLPTAPGLTSDDRQVLEDSLQSVLSLVPKLRELGIVSKDLLR